MARKLKSSRRGSNNKKNVLRVSLARARRIEKSSMFKILDSLRSLERNKKILKPLNIAILSLIIGVVFFARFVGATTKTAGPLEVTYTGDTIFAETNLAPGDIVYKDITVKNNGSVAHSFAIATENVSGDLSDKITISPVVDNVTQWSKTTTELSQLSEKSMTILSSINPGETKSVTLQAQLAANIDDNSQGKNLSFDVVFGTQEAEPAVQTSTGGFATLLGRGAIGAGAGAAVSSTTSESTPAEGGNQGGGEVKGAGTSNKVGENFWLLLIVPVVALGALVAMPSSIIRNIGLPLFSGAVAVVLSNYIKGHVDPTVFWTVLGGEVLVTGGVKIVLGDKHKDWYHRRRKSRKK